MATITWTGATDLNFHVATNWDLGSVPGTSDTAVIDGFSTVLLLSPTPLTIGALDISATFVVFGGADLTATGQTVIRGASGFLSTEPDSQLAMSGIAIESGGLLHISGSILSGSTDVDVAASGVGDLSIFSTGKLTLNGAMSASVQNYGTVTVTAPAEVSNVANQLTGFLFLQSQLAVAGDAYLGGNIEVTLGTTVENAGQVAVQGALDIGIADLDIKMGALGSMSAGAEKTLFSSVSTSIDSFSVQSFSVEASAADFAYALRLVGTGDAVGSLALLAINSSTTGGRAVLNQSATNRAITLSIDSETGRGTIRGGTFADLFDSLLHGVDEVRGGSGNDVMAVSNGAAGFTLAGNAGGDSLSGGVGDDRLLGGADDDTLSGGTGVDLLDGGTGNDQMSGSFGDDIYIIDSTADVVIEDGSGGTDLVRSTVSLALADWVENGTALGSAAINLAGNDLGNWLNGNAGNNRLSGDAGVDTLSGGAGNDTLDGGIGADAMIGGAGDDVYVVDDAGDTVSDADGIDEIRTSVSSSLHASIENGTALGTTALDLRGNALGNRLLGNAANNLLSGIAGDDTLNGGGGNDTLGGGIGADVMIGGAGDDVFVVDNIGDRVSDASGVDLVRTSISFGLGAGIENGAIIGAGAVTLTGNDLNNQLFGNAENNILRGGTGRDTLTGGRGDDTLTGGTGSDTFVFVRLDGQDRITDFVAAGPGSDKIDLSGHSQITSFADLQANHLSAVGNGVLITSGSHSIRLVNVQLADLNATDFIF